MMKIKYLFVALALATALLAHAELQFTGNTHQVYEETPAANTGLNRVYVLYSTDGVGLTYTADTENPVTWYTYGEMGGGYAEELTTVQHEGLTTSIAQLIPNKGYVIEEGTSRFYFWVTDYSGFRLSLTSASVESDGDCGTATIHVEGLCPDIVYYTITGVRTVLDRGLTLRYNNLVWGGDITNGNEEDEEEEAEPDMHWLEQEIVEPLASFKNAIAIPAPTLNTTFTVSGDKFLQLWEGQAQSVETGMYSTAAIDVRTIVVQEDKEHDNEKKLGGETLGGSAPAHITFTALCTDAVVHKEWQMSRDIEFNDVELRLNQEEVDQVFEDAGISYWRFYATNAAGTCEWYSDVYTVNIGESELVCPNVFTPGTSEGVNDIWKVSYRSIVKFHCCIFNKWGNMITEFSEPWQGWDGTYRGKQCPAGAYYYVIQAEGSDGKKYKLSGDINIIRYKRVDHGTSGDGTIISGGE